MSESRPLVIVGASTRAAAHSARLAGYQPWCIDLFADRDLQRIADVQRCPAADYPHGILRLLKDAPQAPVLLTGAMENHPQVLRAIELDRPLWGCAASAMEMVRDPDLFRKPPVIPGIAWPRVVRSSLWLNFTRRLRLSPIGRRRYLRKSIRSAGGAGIIPWSPREKVNQNHFLQEHMPGQPISAVYRADGWSAQLLGVTRQIIADEHFGTTHPFQYCGSLSLSDLHESATLALSQLGIVMTQRFDLRGLFGIDAILSTHRKPRIYPVEINPRYTASVEIIERATGRPALAPLHKLSSSLPTGTIHGKAILFTQSPGLTPDLYELFTPREIADVPPISQPLTPGQPICTLFAEAADESDCLGRLHVMAERLYTRLRT